MIVDCCGSLSGSLRREGFSAATAASGEEGARLAGANEADLLLLDLKLPDIEGKELIRRLSDLRRCPPFIIITGQGDERVAVEMMKVGARDYLVKDVDFLQFVPEVVKHALEQIETQRRLAVAEQQVHLIQSVMEQGFSAALIANAKDPDLCVLYVNPAFTQATGYSPETVIGKPLSALSGLSVILPHLEQGISDEQPFLEEVSAYQSLYGERWGEWRVGPVKDKEGHITHWLVILRDITDRKRLEREILEISDREQRRIGQDLHDGLCQQLAGIELMSQVLEQKLAGRSKSDAARVGEIAGHVRDAIGQTRLLARGLSPVTLESEGLMSALQELTSNTEKIFNVACRFECDSPVLVDDQAAATHLFRIAQEAVSNAIKHGKATRISIRLERTNGSVVLTVDDNGGGFIRSASERKGMGIRIMQSRAGMIAGTLAIRSRLKKSTSVTCSVALKSEKNQTQRSRGTQKEKPKRQKENPHC